jgi:hypothetical protein
MSIRHGGIRRLYSGLLVLAVLLHAFVPDGFMPDVRHAGMARMTICPGMAGMHHEEPGKTQSHHRPCPFTPLATPDLPGNAAIVQTVPVYPSSPEFNIHALPAQETAKPWQSRGPPLFLTSA